MLSNQQIASVIGQTIGSGAASILGPAAESDLLKAAGLTQDQHTACLVLLSAAAALHAIESAQLRPENENELAEALFAWCKDQQGTWRTLLTENLDSAAEEFSKAHAHDLEHPPRPSDISEMELALGDLFFALGPETDERAQACLRLSMVKPKPTWESSWHNTMATLEMAGLRAAKRS